MATKAITRTILGAGLQTNYLLGKTHVLLPHSTLNEKFNILPPDVSGNGVLTGEHPSIKCLVIGNKGHRMVTGADSIPYTSPVQHRSTDFALFNHIPFAMRDIVAGEDITSGTFVKSNYCLRKEQTVDGTLYAVYYGRRLNPSIVIPTVKHFVIEDGEVISNVDYVPDSANLTPVQPDPPNESVVVTTADYLAVSAILPLVLDVDAIAELKNVAMILYSNEDMAIISEIGVCTGIDMSIGVSPAFLEVKCCQIITHMVTYHAAANVNNGLEMNLELGATEPLLALSGT